MTDGIKIIRYNLIINFLLFVLLLIFAILAYTAEKDNSSILYSPEKADRYCYPDIHCNEPDLSYNSTVTLEIAGYSGYLLNQNITFQSYDSIGGICEQIFNIYLGTSSLPAGVKIYNGLCAGYINYSSIGTSIYLYSYYNQSATCWNPSSIAGLLSKAYEGTSSYILNQALLQNTNNAYLKFSLTNQQIGLCVYTTNTGPSSLFNHNLALDLYPVVGQDSNSEISGTMWNYIYANQVAKYAATTTGLSHQRCIDPSYASQYFCKELHWNSTSKLWTNVHNTSTPGLSVCNVSQVPGSNTCGVPFCYSGSPPASAKKSYQEGGYSVTSKIAGLTAGAAANIKYKGKPVLGGIYSGLTPDGSGVTTLFGAPQAQKLLFCGGKTIGKNNMDNKPLTDPAAAYPTVAYASSKLPEVANQPNAQTDGDKVILGFK